MAEDESIDALLDDYRSAVHTKDVDALIALYDDDVRVFDTWGRWSYDGVQPWRANVAEWFGSLGDDRVAVAFDEVRTVPGDGVAAVDAYITYRGLSAAGEELRSMQNRLTWVLRRGDDGWRIVHEHTSAPADFGTGKVTLER